MFDANCTNAYTIKTISVVEYFCIPQIRTTNTDMYTLDKIIRILTITAQAPRAFTSSVETMLMRVSTLLELSGVEFSCQEFYCKHGGREGNRYLLELPANTSFDDWTKIVVNDAIKMIEAKQNEAS